MTKTKIDLRLTSMFYPVGVYINRNLKQINIMYELILETIENNGLNNECYLICRGSSGAIIAGIIASKLGNCEILHIKKPEELDNSHSTNKFRLLLNKTFIIIDDFITTGDTMNSIYQSLIETGFPHNKQIDILCVTDEPRFSYLNFRPKYTICEKLDFSICKNCGNECINSHNNIYKCTKCEHSFVAL